MKTWASWVPDLLPRLPQCPVAIVERELLRAAQVFFERSRAWTVDVDAIPVEAGNVDLSILPEDFECDLVRINDLWFDATRLSVTTSVQLARHSSDDWRSHSGRPNAYLQNIPGVVRLYPIPVDAGEVSVNLSVKPSDSASGIPDELYVAFREQIRLGAMARLMLYEDKPWSKPDAGVKAEAEFNAAIDKALTKAERSFGSARITSPIVWC